MTRCGTCHVDLEAGEALRSHYNSELHLTNVRRRVEGLRPLTTSEFRGGFHVDVGGDEDGVGSGAPVFSCTLCKKTFRSVQTLQTHVRSTAHLMRKEQRIIARDSEAATMLTMTSLGSAAMGLHRRHNAKRTLIRQAEKSKVAVPKVDREDREADTDETRCLFCGHPAETLEANVTHMCRIHNFTVPMVDHCTNIAGLIAYLSRKVNGLMCIVCNEKTRSFVSLEALRAHMHERHHERIVLNPEYQEFYRCHLDDPEGRNAVQLEGVRGDELVLVEENGEKKKVLLKRETEVPRPRQRETTEQAERRKAITAAENETLALVKKEQRALLAERTQEDRKLIQRSGGEFKRHQLKVSLRSNKLHPKGYDGEGLVN